MPTENDHLVNSREVMHLTAQNNQMGLWRLRKHHGLPEPIKIGNRNYWRHSEVMAWIEQMEAASRPEGARNG